MVVIVGYNGNPYIFLGRMKIINQLVYYRETFPCKKDAALDIIDTYMVNPQA